MTALLKCLIVLCALSAALASYGDEPSDNPPYDSETILKHYNELFGNQDGNPNVTRPDQQSDIKPTQKRIMHDLIGHNINEGELKKYYGPDWRWRIDEGEIQNLEITDTLANDNNIFVIEAKVNLKPRANYSFDTRLKIIYRHDNKEGWVLDSVKALDGKITSDGLYDDCVRVVKYSDIYGVHWYLRNTCDATLTVLYRVWTSSGQESKKLQLSGNSEGKASVWSLNDLKIDYVLREY